MVLLIAAGLLLKSFWRLRTTDLGCATDNVLTMSYSLPAKKYDTPEKVNAFNETLLERVRAMPGVRAAALGSIVPGAGPGEDDDFTIPEHPPISPGAALPDALYRTADPGYFSALQIPLLRGASLPARTASAGPTQLSSAAIGAAVFPRRKSAGQASPCRCTTVTPTYEIVGVVADTLYQVGQPAMAAMYFPILERGRTMKDLTLVVRDGVRSAGALHSGPETDCRSSIPNCRFPMCLPCSRSSEQSLGNASLSATLVLAFAVLSLLLASVGLYGVLSYLTTQRTAEIGVRIALGAQREQVLRLMLGDGLRPALYGLVLGLAASAGAVRLIQSMLYETRPLDPAIFAAVAATLLLVAALACLVPAWRASRIDPMQALRGE